MSATTSTGGTTTIAYNIPADAKGRDMYIVPIKEVLKNRTIWFNADGSINRFYNNKLGGSEAADMDSLYVNHSYMVYFR